MVALGLVTTEHLEGEGPCGGAGPGLRDGGRGVLNWHQTEAVGLGFPVRWQRPGVTHLLCGWCQVPGGNHKDQGACLLSQLVTVHKTHCVYWRELVGSLPPSWRQHSEVIRAGCPARPLLTTQAWASHPAPLGLSFSVCEMG